MKRKKIMWKMHKRYKKPMNTAENVTNKKFEKMIMSEN